MPAFSKTERMLAATASHHSLGSCSDHNGFGICSVCGEDATAITRPCSSMINALLDVVDVSMPRKYDMDYSNPNLSTSLCTSLSSLGQSGSSYTFQISV